MSKKVSFTVGATLDGPVTVEHIVETDEKLVNKKKEVTVKTKSQSFISKEKNTGKRTCGHSQKDARLRKKNS